MHSEENFPYRFQLLASVQSDVLSKLKVPLYGSYISAGFPSPADDYVEDKIDLGSFLVRNPASTYMMRVRGNSMIEANIHDGDILVIDKSLQAEDGLPVVCFLDGAFTVKTFRVIKKKAFLMPANPAYKPIEVLGDMDVKIWGVVVWILHKPVKQ